MIQKLGINEQFEYKKLTEEEMQQRGILGRLVGPIADCVNATRNGRKYSNELWEAVFNKPLIKEKFERGGIFGEFGHPVDRKEIDPEKIAIIMPQPPKKDTDGKLVAMFDILNTPCGKILKTVCDYGYKIGVSSRGDGELDTDFDGNESVIPDTYDLECWDAVIIPSVKAATPTYVTESLNTKSLKQALTEQLNNANVDDRKVMQEALQNLNIGYSSEMSDNIDDNSKNNSAVDNNQANVFKELQEALKHNQSLELQIRKLQEKLSVRYTKEVEKDNKIDKQSKAIKNLSESCANNEVLQRKVKFLEEQLQNKEEVIDNQSKQLEKLKLQKGFSVKQESQLNESLSDKNSQITDLRKQVVQLTEQLKSNKLNDTKSIKQLQEELQEIKTDSAIKNKEYSKKLTEAKENIEKYKKIANKAVDKYICSKADMLGVSSEEIRNKLNESYSFADIDFICEELKDYQLNVSKLPFLVDNTSKKSKMKITESKETIIPNLTDDTVDSSLYELANLY